MNKENTDSNKEFISRMQIIEEDYKKQMFKIRITIRIVLILIVLSVIFLFSEIFYSLYLLLKSKL